MRSLIRSEGPLRECLGVFAVVVAAYLLLRGSALFLVGAFNDDGAYVMLGKSLADGSGYRLTYLVGAPVAVKYPPRSPRIARDPMGAGWNAGRSAGDRGHPKPNRMRGGRGGHLVDRSS